MTLTFVSAQYHHNTNLLAWEHLPHATGAAHFFQVISDGTKFLDQQRTQTSSGTGCGNGLPGFLPLTAPGCLQ